MKKQHKILISVAVAVAVFAIVALSVCAPRTGSHPVDIWAPSRTFDLAQTTVLDKQAGKDYKIVLMTDLQLWTDLSANAEVYALMDELVELERPDLIILPGDNVSGIATDMLLRQLIRKMEGYGIPWAPVFGNHDAEGNATLDWQADRLEAAEHCLFRRGPSNLYGVGNYALTLRQGDEILYSLYLMDNGRYMRYEDGSFRESYMDYAQIAWYRWNCAGIDAYAGKRVPNMTFSHFAPPQFRSAIETCCTLSDDGRYYVPESLGYGSCAYLPYAAPVDSGFFAAGKECGLTHMFVGHDHESDASILYDGVRLTYGLKTGCSPAPWNDALHYGATVVTISDDATVAVSQTVLRTR